MMPMFRVFSRGTCRAMLFFSETHNRRTGGADTPFDRFFVSRCSVRNRRTTAFFCVIRSRRSLGKTWKTAELRSSKFELRTKNEVRLFFLRSTFELRTSYFYSHYHL